MKKILLIEDNPEMLENTKAILELANYQVITATNGKEGLDAAESSIPDIIICDVMMPELDGYGTLYLLSKNQTTQNIPFIFLTAKAERSDYRKGMELGADDYITKPFSNIELLNAVDSRLKKTESLKKEFEQNEAGLHDFISDARKVWDLNKLSEEWDVKRVPKKASIYKEGEYPRGIFFIKKGKVKVYKTHELGKELIISLNKEGDFLGYLALMEESVYTDSAEAMDDTEISFMPKDDFFALVFQNRDLSQKFIKMLSGNLAEKEEQLIRLAYTSVRKRVAEALLTVYKSYKTDEKQFTTDISRENLANLAGTAKETVIRTLSDFKDEGLIEINGSGIVLIDYKRLSAMKN
jgi:CheY-like chemotaxis protein